MQNTIKKIKRNEQKKAEQDREYDKFMISVPQIEDRFSYQNKVVNMDLNSAGYRDEKLLLELDNQPIHDEFELIKEDRSPKIGMQNKSVKIDLPQNRSENVIKLEMDLIALKQKVELNPYKNLEPEIEENLQKEGRKKFEEFLIKHAKVNMKQKKNDDESSSQKSIVDVQLKLIQKEREKEKNTMKYIERKSKVKEVVNNLKEQYSLSDENSVDP